jgi:hypothetical protein
VFIFDDILLDAGEGEGGGAGGADPEKEKRESELKRARDEAAAERKARRDLERRMEELEANRSKEDEEKLANEKKWEDLAAKRQARITELEGQLTALEATKTELDAMKASRRSELVERLPETIRAEFAGEDVTIAELERAVKMAGAIAPGETRKNSTGSEGAGEGSGGANPSLDDIEALKKSDPAAYQKALIASPLFGAAAAAPKTIFG